MIIDCQLKSLLKNYLKTIIVGFGQADVLGLTVILLFMDMSFLVEESHNCVCLIKRKWLRWEWYKMEVKKGSRVKLGCLSNLCSTRPDEWILFKFKWVYVCPRTTDV